METLDSTTRRGFHSLWHYRPDEGSLTTTLRWSKYTYNIICDKLAPETPQGKEYAELVKILGDHFEPKPLEIVENYRFHMRKQQDRETMEDYSIALRKLAINCNFGTYLDTSLRIQFVFGLRN